MFNSSNVWTPTNARWIVNTNVLHSASLSILALTPASCDTRRHFSLIRIVTLLNRCHRETNTGWYRYGHGEQMDILGYYWMHRNASDWNWLECDWIWEEEVANFEAQASPAAPSSVAQVRTIQGPRLVHAMRWAKGAKGVGKIWKTGKHGLILSTGSTLLHLLPTCCWLMLTLSTCPVDMEKASNPQLTFSASLVSFKHSLSEGLICGNYWW